MPARILLVDDDPITLRLLANMVHHFGHLPEVVSGGEAALERLADTTSSRIDVMVLDLVMPDTDGMTVLERVRQMPAPPAIIVQTAQGGIDTAVSAMRAGAFDFIVKPASPERLGVAIANALKLTALTGEVERLRNGREDVVGFTDLAADAPVMARTVDLARRAARSAIPILLEGDPGTGKEWLARAIHGESPRRARPFVIFNCGAMPPEAVEDALFGTPARPGSPATRGRLQEAQGGTLLLKQIADLPAGAQARLAAIMEDGTLSTGAQDKSQRADFRLLATTSRRLVDRVAEGGFREDLFYRLNVFPIWLPPLRERPEDIAPLAQAFLTRFAAEEGRSRLKGLSQEAEALLLAFAWPGNIRQLENAIYRAVILCEGELLRPWDFPQVQTALDAGAISALVKAWQNEAEETVLAERLAGISGAAPALRLPLQDVAAAHHGRSETLRHLPPRADKESPSLYGSVQLVDRDGELRPLATLEEAAIRFAVGHYGGRMSEVARRLGIGRSTLYRKLKEYGIAEADAA
ncbi:sigma-54 dependent transcriptional regulator [Afifella sp. IM 167]|uniref:sigma-54-dependent transcriptional regulator n=1 Tax=Afifella sp. IM 167 TaxID=2033586 RepID=UPI001CCD4D63|nr:sigma-54 dependent transcriptional regulator [Afifella sp. IM 167]MBZ8135333.1 sigma-54-dependent Fis family transcriptional regulator [Afifella sp. IM 167]